MYRKLGAKNHDCEIYDDIALFGEGIGGTGSFSDGLPDRNFPITLFCYESVNKYKK